MMKKNEAIITKKQRQDLLLFIQKIEHHRKILDVCDHSYNSEIFFDEMVSFWQTIINSNCDLYSVFQHSEYFWQHGNAFQNFERYFIRGLRSEITQENSSIKHILQNPIIKECYLEVLQDLETIDLETIQNIVFVDCGPILETLSHLYKNTDIASIICIDKNEESVHLCSKIIQEKSLSDRVSFINISPSEYDYSDAGLIYVSAATKDKKAAFQQINNTSLEPNKIITRNHLFGGNIFYENTLSQTPHRLAVTYKSTINPNRLFETLTLEKLDLES